MPSHPARLRKLQVQCHSAIDRAYLPLSVEASRLVLRYSEDDRITPQTKRRVMESLAIVLGKVEPEIAAVIVAQTRRAETLAEEAFDG